MVEQDPKKQLELINDFVIQEARISNSLLNREEDLEGIFDATYKGTLSNIIKTHEARIIKMIRWYIELKTLPVPDAFTDAEVDLENLEIRTKQ